MDITSLSIKHRTFNALKNAGFTKVNEVMCKSDSELLALEDFDSRALLDFRECTYCLDCEKSIYKFGGCYVNKIHLGRFLSDAQNRQHCPHKLQTKPEQHFNLTNNTLIEKRG